MTVGIAVVGLGYWGPNLVRNFQEVADCRVVMVADPDPARVARVCARVPGVAPAADLDAVLAHPAVDAVVLATPVSTHAPLAERALRAGRHVLVEKPLAATPEEAEGLVALADTLGRVLLVDHTFAYHGVTRHIAGMLRRGELGRVHYYDAVRINLGLFQRDASVIQDLAVHDLALLDTLFPSRPVAVSATGAAHLPGQPEDVAWLTLYYPDDLVAHLHVSWLAPVKIRQTLLSGSDRMVVWDDLHPSEKLRIYDRGVELGADPAGRAALQVGYRSGGMVAPWVDPTEALRHLARHFVAAVRGVEAPLTDGQAGLRVVRQMAAAGRSMARRGAAVELG